MEEPIIASAMRDAVEGDVPQRAEPQGRILGDDGQGSWRHLNFLPREEREGLRCCANLLLAVAELCLAVRVRHDGAFGVFVRGVGDDTVLAGWHDDEVDGPTHLHG